MPNRARENKSALIFASDRCEDAAHSGGDLTFVLPSRPMLGDAFLEAVANAADSEEDHTRMSAAWAVVLTAWNMLEHGRCNMRLAGDARRKLRPDTYVTFAGHLLSVLAIADGSEFVPGDWRVELARRLLKLGAFFRSIVLWDLSADVYGIVASIDDLPRHVHVQARIGEGWALRELGCFADAAEVYDHIAEIAERAGDVEMALEADLGAAKVLAMSGAFEKAKAPIERVRDTARHHGYRAIEARCHTDLGYIAGRLDDYKGIVQHCDDAIRCGLSPMEEERCLSNIAFAYWKLAWADDAQRIATRIAEQSGYDSVRIECHLLLYDMAIVRRDLSAMGYFRTLLRSNVERMTPVQMAELETLRTRDTAVVYSHTPSETADATRPVDADPELVSIADRLRTSRGIASVA